MTRSRGRPARRRRSDIDDVVGIGVARSRLSGHGLPERDRRDLFGSEELVVRLRPPNLDVDRPLRRRLREHHPDRQRGRLVVDQTEREQPVDEPLRHRVRADLPGAGGPSLRPEQIVNLRAHLLDLLGTQTEPLGDVRPRLIDRAHPEDVAVVDDPLVRRTERRIGVRVLRELEDPIHGGHRSGTVDSHCVDLCSVRSGES
jgi:hypothetical protein